MGSWSTQAPGGVTWGAERYDDCNRTYYKLKAYVCSARGEGSTYYVKVKLVTSKIAEGVPPGEVYFFVGNDFFTVNNVAYVDKKIRYYTGSGGSPDSGFTIRAGVSDVNGSASGGIAAIISDLYIPPVNTYTVSFNANGGTGTTPNQTKVSGEALTIQDNSFTKERYRFVTWNTSADGTGTNYPPGSSYTTNAALTLYAIWEKATMPVYVSDGNGVYEADAVYANVGGEICECAVYANIDGEIKEIV